MADQAVKAALQAESARLIALLEAHGIEWRPPLPDIRAARPPESSRLSTTDKVTLFRRLFRGRTDVFPVRWEGKTSGKSGYAPACANEVARRGLRKAAYQMWRLQQAAVDPTVRRGHL